MNTIKFALIALVAYGIMGMAGLVSLAPIDTLIAIASRILS